jgi:transposase
VRVTTALNRPFALRGASVTGVRLSAERVIVGGSGCAAAGSSARCAGRPTAVCTTGSCAAGATSIWPGIAALSRLRRVDCRDCGVRVDAVPRARPGARHTREFEDLVAFCAQRMAKNQVQALLRAHDLIIDGLMV